MASRSKKERKQQKRRKKKQKEAARREDYGPVSMWGLDEAQGTRLEGSVAESLDLPRATDELAALLGVPRELDRTPTGEVSEAELWWGKYSEVDGAGRLQMTREKLAAVSPEDGEYPNFFPAAISELQLKLNPVEYVAFLEELRESHPEAFALSADWHVRSMVSEYLAQERLEDVDRTVIRFSEELTEVTEPFSSLMSMIRLAGRTQAARVLIDSAVQRLDDSDLMDWAEHEILEWAMFFHYQDCAAADATDEAIETLHDSVRQLGAQDAPEYQQNRRTFVLHLVGKSGRKWTRAELTANDQDAYRNIHFLGVDYQRWLCETRDFAPIVADEFRRLVGDTIGGIDCPYSGLLTGLPRRKVDRYLAGKLGFMSLDRIDVPATIIALQHYYDFLKEQELVRAGEWQKSQSVCNALWKQLQDAAREEWRNFTFLEPYKVS